MSERTIDQETGKPREPASFINDARSCGDWAWVFHRSMTQADRDAFDAWLVVGRYPIAEEAGTQETRFRRMVGA